MIFNEHLPSTALYLDNNRAARDLENIALEQVFFCSKPGHARSIVENRSHSGRSACRPLVKSYRDFPVTEKPHFNLWDIPDLQEIKIIVASENDRLELPNDPLRTADWRSFLEHLHDGAFATVGLSVDTPFILRVESDLNAFDLDRLVHESPYGFSVYSASVLLDSGKRAPLTLVASPKIDPELNKYGQLYDILDERLKGSEEFLEIRALIHAIERAGEFAMIRTLVNRSMNREQVHTALCTAIDRQHESLEKLFEEIDADGKSFEIGQLEELVHRFLDLDTLDANLLAGIILSGTNFFLQATAGDEELRKLALSVRDDALEALLRRFNPDEAISSLLLGQSLGMHVEWFRESNVQLVSGHSGIDGYTYSEAARDFREFMARAMTIRSVHPQLLIGLLEAEHVVQVGRNGNSSALTPIELELTQLAAADAYLARFGIEDRLGRILLELGLRRCLSEYQESAPGDAETRLHSRLKEYFQHPIISKTFLWELLRTEAGHYAVRNADSSDRFHQLGPSEREMGLLFFRDPTIPAVLSKQSEWLGNSFNNGYYPQLEGDDGYFAEIAPEEFQIIKKVAVECYSERSGRRVRE